MKDLRREEMRERFLRERQILASLNHVGIARFFGAGHTEDGQPYLVMECVKGVPLDVYCEKLPFLEQPTDICNRFPSTSP